MFGNPCKGLEPQGLLSFPKVWLAGCPTPAGLGYLGILWRPHWCFPWVVSVVVGWWLSCVCTGGGGLVGVGVVLSAFWHLSSILGASTGHPPYALVPVDPQVLYGLPSCHGSWSPAWAPVPSTGGLGVGQGQILEGESLPTRVPLNKIKIPLLTPFPNLILPITSVPSI